MSAVQINIEYFFRLLYDLVYGAQAADVNYAALKALAADIWLWIVAIGYLIAIAALIVIGYATTRLRDIRKREEEYYRTPIASEETARGVNPRWTHIEQLSAGSNSSEWKEAIIEADIMLDDALRDAGYSGDTIADKLKSIDPSRLASLQDAWEAHRIRNEIAHRGLQFDLSEAVARRTLIRFETVLRELGAI
jgi:hypothetical protein